MATITVNGNELGTSLQALLCCEEIQPGYQPSYEMCKIIYEMHPLGAKMTAGPIKMAQSQKRELKVTNAPGIEDRLVKAFTDEWRALEFDKRILNLYTQCRVYGISSIAMMIEGVAPMEPIDFKTLYEKNISFNILDPLNTAGSLVLNQDPNAFDFQKISRISIAGIAYHPSRTRTVMNEQPIYISYTTSAYGFVGRSVYQRGLFPLKSFISSLVTDDMVVKKAGLLIAMIKAVSSAVNLLQRAFSSIKITLLKMGESGNVLQVGHEDKIETLNMQNLDGAYGAARKNILENIAVSGDMPAMILNSETFAQGFADGSEDAKNVAHFIDLVREDMNPTYAWADTVTMHRAWNPNFYKTIQKQFPEQYGGVPFEQAFYEWKNSYVATWPNLLTEPDSEKAKFEDVRLKALIALVQVLLPELDPDNKATLVAWVQDNFNAFKTLFTSPLVMDFDLLKDYVPPVQEEESKPGHPFANQDSVVGDFKAAVARLDPKKMERAKELIGLLAEAA